MSSITPNPAFNRRTAPGSRGPFRRRQQVAGISTKTRNVNDPASTTQIARANAFERALRLDDLDRAFRLVRRLRDPDGPILTDLATLGELLEREFPVPSRYPRDVPPDGWGLLAWPSPLNDLVELTQAAAPELFDAVASELSRIVYGLTRGTALALLPGQEELHRFRRVLVPPPEPGLPAAVIVVTDPFPHEGHLCVELLAVLPAGALVTEFYHQSDIPDEEPAAEESDEP